MHAQSPPTNVQCSGYELYIIRGNEFACYIRRACMHAIECSGYELLLRGGSAWHTRMLFTSKALQNSPKIPGSKIQSTAIVLQQHVRPAKQFRSKTQNSKHATGKADKQARQTCTHTGKAAQNSVPPPQSIAGSSVACMLYIYI